MMEDYDLIIIGAGPAGAMAAKTVAGRGMSTLVIDKGQGLAHRRDLVSGWFGRALFAMDHLDLEDNVFEDRRAMQEVFRFVRKVASQQNMKIFKLGNRMVSCRLPSGTGQSLASYLFDSISNKAEVRFNTEVISIRKEGDRFLVEFGKNRIKARRCLIATGRNSIAWAVSICSVLGLRPFHGSAKIGVRVEVPTFKVNHLIEGQCNLPNASDTHVDSSVGEWEESDMISAIGCNMPDILSKRTNFMVGFDTNSDDAIRDTRIVNVLANDRVRHERVDDFIHGKSILAHLPAFKGLSDVFQEMNNALPSFSNYAVMHVPEIMLCGVMQVDDCMRTSIEGLYSAGECTTRAHTLLGAMASGMIAGRTMLKE